MTLVRLVEEDQPPLGNGKYTMVNNTMTTFTAPNLNKFYTIISGHFNVTRVDRLATGSRILTLREVLMKRHNILKARLELEQETRGLSSQPDGLWIHKTNAVIA